MIDIIFLTPNNGKILNEKEEVIGSIGYDRKQEKYIADINLNGKRKIFYNSSSRLIEKAISIYVSKNKAL